MLASITRAACTPEKAARVKICLRTLYGLAQADPVHEEANFYDSTVQKVVFFVAAVMVVRLPKQKYVVMLRMFSASFLESNQILIDKDYL